MNNYWENVFGWFDWHGLYNNLAQKYDNCIGIEIGSFQGKSMCYLSSKVKEMNKSIRLISVDLFPTNEELDVLNSRGAGQGEEGQRIKDLADGLLNTFVRNIRASGTEDIVTPIKGDSHKVAKLFSFLGIDRSKIKWVYLDGCHDYEYVLEELKLWYPLIADDGVIAGHDASDLGVKRAVTEFFNGLSKNFRLEGETWIHEK